MNYLEKISNIDGTLYKWNRTMEKISGKYGYEYGLLAQQVKKEFPEMVFEGDDGYLTIDYIQMIPVLVECIKELKQELDNIKNK